MEAWLYHNNCDYLDPEATGKIESKTSACISSLFPLKQLKSKTIIANHTQLKARLNSLILGLPSLFHDDSVNLENLSKKDFGCAGLFI